MTSPRKPTALETRGGERASDGPTRGADHEESKFTEEQIAYALRQVESGTPPVDVCRQLGVSEATFYIWKKKYAHLGVSELSQLRSQPGSLDLENPRARVVGEPPESSLTTDA